MRLGDLIYHSETVILDSLCERIESFLVWGNFYALVEREFAYGVTIVRLNSILMMATHSLKQLLHNWTLHVQIEPRVHSCCISSKTLCRHLCCPDYFYVLLEGNKAKHMIWSVSRRINSWRSKEKKGEKRKSASLTYFFELTPCTNFWNV